MQPFDANIAQRDEIAKFRGYLPAVSISIDQLKRCYSPEGRLCVRPIKALILTKLKNGKITARQAERFGVSRKNFYSWMDSAVRAGLIRKVVREGRPTLWCAISYKKIPLRHATVRLFLAPRGWRDNILLRTWAYMCIGAHTAEQSKRHKYMIAKRKGEMSDKHYRMLDDIPRLSTSAVASACHISPSTALRHLHRASATGMVACCPHLRTGPRFDSYEAARHAAIEYNAATAESGQPFSKAGFARVRRIADRQWMILFVMEHKWLFYVPCYERRTKSLMRLTRPIRHLTRARFSLQIRHRNDVLIAADPPPSFYDEYEDVIIPLYIPPMKVGITM